MLMQVTRHSKTLRMPLGIGHKQNRKLREVDVTFGENACWLVVSTHLKNVTQIGSFHQLGVKIKNT